MLIDIKYGNFSQSDALDAHIEDRVQQALVPFNGRITRVVVFLADEASPRKKTVHTCKIEARPAGFDPIAVESRHEDSYYSVVTESASKLRRALEHRFAKARAAG